MAAAPSIVGDDCHPLDEHPAFYQAKAREAHEARTKRTLLPHAWASPTCETEFCLAHFTINTPRWINYPSDACVYCGVTPDTRDHLQPRGFTGEADRRFVAMVPACRECNSAIGDRGSCRISERRKMAQEHIQRKYKKNLECPDRTPAEMREYGPTLRAYIEQSSAIRAVVLERLAWPTDPDYDLHAFQSTGIERPYALGLI